MENSVDRNQYNELSIVIMGVGTSGWDGRAHMMHEIEDGEEVQIMDRSESSGGTGTCLLQ